MIFIARRSTGFRNKTRRLLSGAAEKRVTVASRMKEFKSGAKVVVRINPSIHDGMPHPRYYGALGTVLEKRGRAYVVEIKDGGKTKWLIANGEHLKAI
ncbi:50S ribosomal protein L21e [uncultured archaeon]|nr:50S ribosomal protein L21e [uncultured archaeon]